MRLSDDIVQHVANLARIRLLDDKRDQIGEDLGQILTYVEMLEQVDTSRVEPTWQAANSTGRVRSDEVHPSLPRELALSNGPNVREHMFLIPRILGEGEEN